VIDSGGRELIAGVRAGLAAAANPEKAPQMQAYMKSALPYHGVPMPEVRRITRAVFADHPLEDRATWESTVRALFDEASHREEWYAALMLPVVGSSVAWSKSTTPSKSPEVRMYWLICWR